MIVTLRKKKLLKPIAVFLLLNFSVQVFLPTVSYALTGGPSQPEVESFEPIGTSEMVDMFSGDFNYNIPLMDVGGYPINISYHSGVTMDQEASWVGLGWNINPGVINRSMRGVPDDFYGDKIKKEFNSRPNETYGVKLGADFELFSISPSATLDLGVGLGLSYNNYNGMGFDMSVSPSVNCVDPNKSTLTMGLGLSASSESGVGISPSVSYQKKNEDKEKRENTSTNSIGLSFNSRGGLGSLTLSSSRGVKKGKVNVSKGGTSSSISFASASYLPQITMPMRNSSMNMSFTIGGAFTGAHPNLRTSCYYSRQELADRSTETPAFGYMNLHDGIKQSEVVLDFNREKDAGYTQNTPNLPLTSLTYDIYSVSGQGIGGTYRPHRSDIGYVYDSKVSSTTSNLDFPGVELGGGNATKVGTNVSVNYGSTVSGQWLSEGGDKDNSASYFYNYKGKVRGLPLYEPYYFKQVGEKTADKEPEIFAAIGGYKAVKVKLMGGKSSDCGYQFPVLEVNGQSDIPMSLDNYRKKRARRNEVIVPLTALEASHNGLTKSIQNYPFNQFSFMDNDYSNAALQSRLDNNKIGHHMSEISVYRNDGARYVYGIPAYNTSQHEVSFSVSGKKPNCATGLVEYIPGIDDTYSNSKGQDNYYSRTVLPPFAHSYLLTAILSADYVDLTGNGPSDDDLGTFTKINYSRLKNANEDKLYKWRVPYEKDMANYNEGMKSLDWTEADSKSTDDKANYLYGEKEIWYVHSIATRTHLAEFTLSDREDACGVEDMSGGYDATKSMKMKRLDKITLYARQDKMLASVPLTSHTAVPIKVVHFEYDYSLCPGVSNNSLKAVYKNGIEILDPDSANNPLFNINKSKGKLTLKKLYFTYGKSKKGELSPYRFNYSEVKVGSSNVLFNPSYNLKGYDRWGNYKPNPTDCNESPVVMTTSDNPYTDQTLLPSNNSYYQAGRSFADVYSHAWTLTTIDLPSGGKINIQYEADDYAFVQNKRAMSMCEIAGMVNGSNFEALKQEETLEDFKQMLEPEFFDAGSANLFMVLKLPYSFPLTSNSINDNLKFLQSYLYDQTAKPIQFLYFRSLVSIEASAQEYVSGYAKIKTDGTTGILRAGLLRNITDPVNGGATYAWIELADEPLGDNSPGSTNSVHPMAKAGWNFTKLNLPRIAYNQSDPNSSNMQGMFEAIASTFTSIRQLADGFNDYMLSKEHCRYFSPSKSFVRLYHPTLTKQGGGSRVKKVLLSDEWDALTENNNYENYSYGQEYSYTTTMDDGRIISSGVAAYEPQIGADENPFKLPVYFKEDKRMVPDETHMQETPYGESFFPGASVGYSVVTVKNLQHEGVSKNATGSVVHEFYTAKDFPTITTHTTVTPAKYKPNPILQLLKLDNKEYMTASQGYSIELNDMHGKPKGQKVYAEGQKEPISGITYKYKLSNQKRLSNKFPTISKNNLARESELVGVDYDVVFDIREHRTEQTSTGLGGNVDAFMAAIVPVAIPMVIPSYSKEETRFRSVVATKVINRFGILEETIAYDLGSTVSTKNVLLDEETGEVLLTKTTNQFNDPVFKFTYPAHWVYDKMGPAYTNVGYTQYYNLNNLFSYPLDPAIYNPGDEVMVTVLQGNKFVTSKAWVVKTNAANGTTACSCPGNTACLKLIDDKGSVIKKCQYIAAIKIVRSSRRNQQSTPVGTVVSLSNPLTPLPNSTTEAYLNFKQVIDANAIEYTDDWKIFCDCDYKSENPEQSVSINPYIAGRLGAWKPKRTWVYLTQRTQSKFNQNTNIRKDGVYATFEPYWQPSGNGGNWFASNPQKRWQYSNEAMVFSPYGFELENKDALDRYSAAVYGYGNRLTKAVSANAKYSETAFDGFEDYAFDGCPDDHFSYKQVIGAPANVTGTTSHSGKKSIQVNGNSSFSLKKVLGSQCP
jgi:hypothetical protein